MRKLRHLVICWVFMLMQLSCQQTKPYQQTGEASYYAQSFAGQETANGEIYDPEKMTAAHRNLPFGTELKVTNLENEKSVNVTINDRGPYNRRRIIDLSRAAAEELNFIEEGEAQVRLKVVKPAPGYSVADSVTVD